MNYPVVCPVVYLQYFLKNFLLVTAPTRENPFNHHFSFFYQLSESNFQRHRSEIASIMKLDPFSAIVRDLNLKKENCVISRIWKFRPNSILRLIGVLMTT